MPKTLYFDSNFYFEVFELRDPTLFSSLEGMVASADVRLVVSELDLMESLSGNHLPGFNAGFERLLSLSPSWVYVSDLATRELDFEDTLLRGGTPPSALVPLRSWPEFLPLISTDEERAAVSSDLEIPTVDSLLEFCGPGVVKARLADHWKPELSDLRETFRETLVAAGSVRNFFWKVTANAVGRSLGASKELVDRLWADPDRAPAHRLKIELTCRKLSTPEARWTTNDFLDHTHAGVVGYVDLFMTRDEGLLRKLQWYDDNVRLPRGALSYGDRICQSWSDLQARI